MNTIWLVDVKQHRTFPTLKMAKDWVKANFDESFHKTTMLEYRLNEQCFYDTVRFCSIYVKNGKVSFSKVGKC